MKILRSNQVEDVALRLNQREPIEVPINAAISTLNKGIDFI